MESVDSKYDPVADACENGFHKKFNSWTE